MPNGRPSWWESGRLKYLFRAFYSNGDVLAQGEDDKSIFHPGRSAFADVDHDRLVAFGIEGQGLRYSVDLKSGAIAVNGTPLLDPDNAIARAKTPLRLIYFRRVSQHSTSMSTESEFHADTEYHIGWQANDSDGANVQRVMVVV